MNLKNNLKFFIIFTLVILLFHWRLITMKSLFIGGDNLMQFYPWFKAYSESIKHLNFPFWTQYMQSGFPLMAEGQIGGYYPLNILFFLILPLNVAYNYAIVFHFIIAGISVYFLTRKLGACEWGGTLAALIFCFGSAYAGCFYNIITLRTLSWTPLVFLLFELFFEKRKPVLVLIAGVIYGMQLLAGFAQIAFYCWIFYLVYFLYRFKLRKTILYFLMFSAISFIIFLPQLMLTYKLLLYSARTTADLQFALWGSFNPIYAAGVVFPYWPGFSVSSFYLSIFGILFLITSFYLLKTDKRLAGIFLIFALSLFLSLGRYNPLYVMFLKLCKFYTFRNPSKFLFFAAMASSVLAGRGFSEFMKDNFRHRNSALRIYCIMLSLCGLTFLVSKVLLVSFKDMIIKAGEWYINAFIFGKSSHRHGLDTYLNKIPSLYNSMVDGTSLRNIFNITSWLLLISALIISWLIINKRKMRMPVYSKGLVIFAITADLFIYSFIGTGFRGNMCSFDILKPTHGTIFNYIKNDKDIFRVLPYGVGTGELPAWIMPNANMTCKIDSVAGYTPLANEYYRKSLSPLEIIDNSLGVIPPEKNSIDDTITLLRLLNVKYIISAEELDKSYLKLVLTEGRIYLYRVTDNLPRAFAMRKLDMSGIDTDIEIKMVEYKSGKALFKADMPYDGFLAFSENNYPGWKAYVNGKPGKIRPFLLINAVELNKGENLVSFVYSPY
ncbi:MAG: hypothetical protein NTY34_00540 [Candidatus Omnitrophica bacterium]|nr:hypothetical protein [Candidatus Omnitrophota bacterium]